MSPYILGGRRMAAAVIKPEVMDFLDLVVHEDGDETEMAVVTVEAGSASIGKTLRDVNPWESCGATLLAVRKPGEQLRPNPSPDLVVGQGDEFILMGKCEEIAAARALLASQTTEA
jgi:voltage-gated potassium channel